MRAAFERFDGTRLVKEMPYVGADATVILIPRRDAFSGEAMDYMRFDKTTDTHEGAPLFKQSSEPLEVTLEAGMVKPTIVQADDKRSVIRA